jgi:hypothetical protein
MKYVPIIVPLFLILGVTAVAMYRAESPNRPTIKRVMATPGNLPMIAFGVLEGAR